MPEIPELEAVRGFLTDHLRGAVITGATVRIGVVVRTGAQELRETLPGDRFGEVGRHGKMLLFRLESGRTLAVNPMLAGRFQYVEPSRKVAAKACLLLDLDHGQHLRYVDDRVMGKLYLVPSDHLDQIPGWAANGPDLLDPALTEDAWVERLQRYRGGIKNILTNAAFVQG